MPRRANVYGLILVFILACDIQADGRAEPEQQADGASVSAEAGTQKDGDEASSKESSVLDQATSLLKRLTGLVAHLTSTEQKTYKPLTFMGPGVNVAEVFFRCAPGVVIVLSATESNTDRRTGFIVDLARGLIVTVLDPVEGPCAVLCGVGRWDPEAKRITLEEDSFLEAAVLKQHPETNLTLLRVNLPKGAHTALQLAEKPLENGAEVYAIVQPEDGLLWQWRSGTATVGDGGKTLIQMSRRAAGEQGAPLLDASGRVAGVLLPRSVQEGSPAPAVPVTQLQEFLQQ